MADIAMTVEAANVPVRRAIGKRTQDNNERKCLFTLLKSNSWTTDKYLSRKMRNHWNRGYNHTNNQIIVRSDNYTVFQLGGKLWIKIPSLIRGRPIAIPLNTTVAPTGTLRLILRNGRVEVHYAIDVEQINGCGDRTIGVDKGYTEVLTDSNGEHHGEGLGKLLTIESDYLKAKYIKRNKIKGLAHKKSARSRRFWLINLLAFLLPMPPWP